MSPEPTQAVIPLCVPSMGADELQLLEQCIADNFVSSVGPFVTEFEQEFAAFVGSEHAVATSSGTTALHVAALLHDIGPDDLVAVSDFTFVASANALAYTGADLLLVDSAPGTWNLDGDMLYADVVERARTGRQIPKAIEVVHILGQPCQLEPLLALRDEYGIVLLEDAAESLGARYTSGVLAGRHVGITGAVGGFSFNGNKIMTTGSGGMLVTNDAALAQRAKHLTTQAKLDGPEYFHDEVGYNYRMSNVTAALGLAQVRRLPGFVDAKARIASAYDELLDADLFARPPQPDCGTPTHWLYTVQVGDGERDELIAGLREEGILARSVWPPLRDQMPYRHCETLGAGVGHEVWRTAVSLPSSVDLTLEQVERVANVANSVLTRTTRR